ncbi:MAG: hypothetical protein OXG88_05370 [Gammaproteobacteria bacterium]|nr:hypothetical protein [Gammaproteobacteria bacterium]
MNTTTSRPYVYLIVALFFFGPPLVVASPVIAIEPEETSANESIFEDCIVKDITLKWPDDSEEHGTKMQCESGTHLVIVGVPHEEPDRIRIDIYLDRFRFWSTDDDTPPYFKGIDDEWDPEEGESVYRSFIWNLKISSKETYKPKDILNDLAEDEEVKFEFEAYDQKHVNTVEFDGAEEAVKEFRKRVKSLQETSNENQ